MVRDCVRQGREEWSRGLTGDSGDWCNLIIYRCIYSNTTDNKFSWLIHINNVYKKGQSTSCFILKGNSPLVSGRTLFSLSPAWLPLSPDCFHLVFFVLTGFYLVCVSLCPLTHFRRLPKSFCSGHTSVCSTSCCQVTLKVSFLFVFFVI